jgi:hypothetical protein
VQGCTLRVCLVELWILKKLLWTVNCRKAAVNCELWIIWKLFLEVVWLYQLWTVSVVRNVCNAPETQRYCLYVNWSENINIHTTCYANRHFGRIFVFSS